MPQRLSRRALLRMTVAGAMTGAVGYALLIEPSEFRVEHVRIQADLPTGLRIGAVSDFHLADAVSQARVEAATKLLADQSPDLITLLGDYSTAMNSDSDIHRHVETALGILSKLSAPLGVYAILGNHDVTRPLADLDRLIRQHGMTPLINAGTMITSHGERFAIAGLADALQAKPNPRTAMQGVPEGVPVLGLIHEPDASSLLTGSSLVLSGHSHGGQVRLPWIGAPVLPRLGRRFPWGLRRNGETLVYTSRGVGTVPPRIRINCPPEITLIEIVNSGGQIPLPPLG